MDPLLTRKRDEILALAERHGAHNLRVFGSAARDERRPDSDVDFLIELAPGRNLFDQVALIQDLEALLQCKVDVVEPEGVYWYIRDRVLDEAVPLT